MHVFMYSVIVIRAARATVQGEHTMWEAHVYFTVTL